MPVRTPLKLSPSSTERRISPIPKSPITATMKSNPFIKSTNPNVIRSWPVTMSSPTAARMNPSRIETSDLSGLPPPRPTKLEKVRSWIAKNSGGPNLRSEEHTSELQSRGHLVCRLLLEKKNTKKHKRKKYE